MACATAFAGQIGIMTQHTGFMIWAFFIGFVYYFITKRTEVGIFG